MARGDVLLRFGKVSFNYGEAKPVLDEVDFSVREGAKVALMGQNGAGKTSIFNLILGELTPEDGLISLSRNGVSIGIAKQVIPREWITLTVREFFAHAFSEKVYDIDPRAAKALEAVNLAAPLDRAVGTFSGGQQARLLLAFSLIAHPDILLLDEPTNNLDAAGIAHLTAFLAQYDKTCIVISHDAGFLNSFTDGVLYLDARTRKVEQYTGTYINVVAEIARRIERERMKNVRLERDIERRREQASFFAQKGGKLRNVASKMREKISELSEDIVRVREEDKAIKSFAIQAQDIPGVVVAITAVSVLKSGKPVTKKVKIELKRRGHLLLSGPNGVGKTTFLEAIAQGAAKGVSIAEGAKVGYYRQDFSTLNFDDRVLDSLLEVAHEVSMEEVRATAARFLLTADLLGARVVALSEGQKALLSFARLVLQKPGVLLLDEPTNHVNFRHIPVIAEALNRYEGAMILVSHVPEFVRQIRIDETLDLGGL